jgi:hypothetical protein
MGGAATPPCRGSTLGKPRLQELNLPMGCSLVAWKLNSYFYPPKLRDFTCLSVLGSSYQLLSSDTDHHRLAYKCRWLWVSCDWAAAGVHRAGR